MKTLQPNRRCLVVGLGNTLCGDDGFGSRVLEALPVECPDLTAVADLVSAGTDLLGRIDSFSHYEHVILVDAILDPSSAFGRPGQVLVLEQSGMGDLIEASPGVHEISPLIGIRLFRLLHPESPTFFSLVALCIGRLTVGDAACSTARAISSACREIRALVLGRSPDPPAG